MSDRNTSDFESRFDEAARRIHRQTPRGDMPSPGVWHTVMAGQNSQPVTSTTTAHQPGGQTEPPTLTQQRKRFGRSRNTSQQAIHTNYLQWTSWLAVIAVVGAMVFGFYSIKQPEPKPTQQSIAMAPTTPEVDTTALNQIATPAASPGFQQVIPTYDPEFACTDVPLSEEDVYQMVINPLSIRYPSLSTPTSLPDRPLYGWETDGDYEDIRFWSSEDSDQFVPVDDPNLIKQLTDTTNMFWNCLMTGTALQVWAMMDPIAVQYEILRYLPVLRDEAMVRQFIREWGPRRYSAGITLVFPDLGNVEQYDASKHADETWGAITALYTYDGTPLRADVRMVPHPDATRWWPVHLILTRAPNGTWWVTTFYAEE